MLACHGWNTPGEITNTVPVVLFLFDSMGELTWQQNTRLLLNLHEYVAYLAGYSLGKIPLSKCGTVGSTMRALSRSDRGCGTGNPCVYY